MANTTKMTKKDYFNALLKIEEVSTNKALVEFINHELDLLVKKNAADKKPTATQTANKATMEAILDAMEDNKYYTITDLIKSVPECADMTNQKVSAIVKQMIDVSVRRVEDKRKAYFVKM